MSLQPRGAESLDEVAIFNEGNVRRRVNDLTRRFMAKLEHDDMLKTHDAEFIKAIKEKRRPRTDVWIATKCGSEREERYGKKARKLSLDILEQERQNYVDARAERDKTMISEIGKKLNAMVWTVDAEGKATKLKRIVERVPTESGKSGFRDVHYVGEHDFERLHQINRLKRKLWELRRCVPYYSKEIQKLYTEAMQISRLEYEHRGRAKSKPKSVEQPAKIKKTKKPVKTKKEKKPAKTKKKAS